MASISQNKIIHLKQNPRRYIADVILYSGGTTVAILGGDLVDRFNFMGGPFFPDVSAREAIVHRPRW